jgi:CubicO group peptidase (beta-lactamase class C family)
MRADAIFQIWSMTKPITSVGIMQLVEKGALELDAAAAEYLPELKDREVLVGIDTVAATFTTRPASRPITIRDLLRHTSGFGYAFASSELVQLDRVSGLSPREQPILHDPGERWTYGMGTAFLGWIIEAVSGESLPGFLSAQVLTPLGMDDTSFELAQADTGRFVATYRRVGDRLEGEPRPDPYIPTVRGDGGLLSTADDYAHFVQMILGGGVWRGKRVLSEASVAEMTRDQLDGMVVEKQPGAIPAWSNDFPLGAGRDGFGLGFQISVGSEAESRPAGSLSWAGIENTHFWIDRQNDIGVVLLLQVLPFYDEKAINLLSNFERALYTDSGGR